MSSLRQQNTIFVCYASMHMMSKMQLTPEELETAKVSQLFPTGFKANGSNDIVQEAMVYVREVDMFVTALSLGKICEVFVHTSGKTVNIQILSNMVKLYLATPILSAYRRLCFK